MVWKNGCLLSYQLPDQIVDWVKNKPLQYFIQMGHGAKASPEIYSGGPGFLISAGGVYQGKRSLIVARPITLLIGDDAQNLNEVSRTNSNQKVLYNKFQFSGGKTVTYDVKSPKNKWVIVTYNNVELDRNFDSWAKMDGEL